VTVSPQPTPAPARLFTIQMIAVIPASSGRVGAHLAEWQIVADAPADDVGDVLKRQRPVALPAMQVLEGAAEIDRGGDVGDVVHQRAHPVREYRSRPSREPPFDVRCLA